VLFAFILHFLINFHCSTSITYLGQTANWLYQEQNIRSLERKFPGTFVPKSEGSHWELSLQGAKIPGNEKSWYRPVAMSMRTASNCTPCCHIKVICSFRVRERRWLPGYRDFSLPGILTPHSESSQWEPSLPGTNVPRKFRSWYSQFALWPWRDAGATVKVNRKKI